MTKTHLVVEEVLDLEELGLIGKVINGRTEIYFYPYSKVQKEIVSNLEHKISDIISYIYCESGYSSTDEEGSAYICCTLSGNPFKKTRTNKDGKVYSVVNYKYVKCYIKRIGTTFQIKLSTITPFYPLDIEETIWESEDTRILVPSKLARYEPLVRSTVARTWCKDPKTTFFYEELDETDDRFVPPRV